MPFSNLICTTQLVLWAIIEQNALWRIDDFSSTAHHQLHIDAGPERRHQWMKLRPPHKNFKNGYTL
ncbi:hypothetical protein FBY06_13826 [Pseudomonas sp. SJZ085]|nr:hypothetical protein FBY00_13626 [Pseudomonas sp. SJZ075]TWC12394.1 hypothetical protein FBX99_13726 [Pseudomonas sp. SJZ074]TWC27133.1 hypothetical protein FBY02_13724 [Pseudomonas sp. SJZ078]TWC30895.1 hypothetical protein FBY06_13826 [Pseudomonas sp. SJZ085]TWC47148.1 hypothetical protein FBY11_13626 [Pseudomonas sp. SJZ124]TWC82755.1 hypothetical protein FBY09_13526 [Pseudomonas sp. SJZ101]